MLINRLRHNWKQPKILEKYQWRILFKKSCKFAILLKMNFSSGIFKDFAKLTTITFLEFRNSYYQGTTLSVCFRIMLQL